MGGWRGGVTQRTPQQRRRMGPRKGHDRRPEEPEGGRECWRLVANEVRQADGAGASCRGGRLLADDRMDHRDWQTLYSFSKSCSGRLLLQETAQVAWGLSVYQNHGGTPARRTQRPAPGPRSALLPRSSNQLTAASLYQQWRGQNPRWKPAQWF